MTGELTSHSYVKDYISNCSSELLDLQAYAKHNHLNHDNILLIVQYTASL